MFGEPNEFHYGILRLPVNSGTARHVREMANTRGKSLPQEGEHRLVESLRAARLRLFDTPTADMLRRLFGERRLVNGAPHRRDETTGRDFEASSFWSSISSAGLTGPAD